MDLWQAACIGNARRIEDLCTGDPERVDAVGDIWRIPRVTALRLSVLCGHDAATAALLHAGADPDHIAGDGKSVREAARESGREGWLAP